MAFTFNWTPLTAPTSSPEFYSHAKELLTTALNSSSQSSTILESDIVVEDLNLGQNAPEIEVLEIGDLANDKFRGVFRISYAGDAFLTLKTRVQVNPFNAYLATSARYTSPDTLAATSPLTIPLQLTLSDIRLSGFVILVFSRAKGITLVFRNDPLESLKVQSTFDSVPFIKDYLQKEIERQIRGIFQEELPVAVYKLSLRLFNPDHASSLGLDTKLCNNNDDQPKREKRPLELDDDPFSADNLSESDYEGSDLSSNLSEANQLRLEALRNSQNTLSLFTPTIPGVLYRAKPVNQYLEQRYATDRSPPTPNNDVGISGHRPNIYSSNSNASFDSKQTTRRKKKRRIINLRDYTDTVSSASSECGDSASVVSAPELINLRMPPRNQILMSQPLSSPPTMFKELGCQTPEVAQINNSYFTPANHRVVDPPRPASIMSEPSPRILRTYEHCISPALQATSRHGLLGGQRPCLLDMPKHPSDILEKGFMMKLVGELQKRAEEDQMYQQKFRQSLDKSIMYDYQNKAAVA